MQTLRHDLRYAVRTLLRNPMFTAAAVVTLALGIGLNAAVFSAVHALLLRPLPGVQQPERLVQLYRTYRGDFLYGSSSIPHFLDVRDRNDVFGAVAAWSFVPLSLSWDGRTERVVGQMASADLFRVMGVEAAVGRTFLPEEDVEPGAHPVVVLSHAFWRDRFAADPGVLGRTLVVNGRAFTVVGVAPEAFRGPMPAVVPELWAPLMMQNELVPGGDRISARGSNFLNVVARLRPGVTVDQARQAMDALALRLAEEYPDTHAGSGMHLVPQPEAGIHPTFQKAQMGMSAVMMVVVGLLLLIACVNVANLFLARARERRREMGIRLSLGARRGRIVRQLLTESLVFSLVAGAAGLGLAWWTVRVLNGVRPPADLPIRFDLALDLPVLLFTAGVALVAGLVFGVAPALQASRPELVSALKGEAPAGAGSRSRATSGLVVAQIALSIMLLVGAGLFLRSLRQATTLDTGFRSAHLLLASVDPGLQGYDQGRTDVFYRELLDRLRSLPGVRAAALGEIVPLGLGSQQRGVEVPGYDPGPDELMSLDYNIVGPGYFEAMGIRVLRGREFQEADAADAPGVLIVNETMANRFWPGQEALGQRVRTAGAEREVVAVVASGRYRSLGEEPLGYMYLPHAQVFNHAMTLHMRTTGSPEALAPLVRAEIRALDSDMPVFDLRTMDNHLGIALLPARLAGTALGVFGLLGLVLAAVGIYGVMAYGVARRTREIGIRMALGADPSEVVGMVLRRGMRIALVGVALGLVGAAATARLVEGLLYGVPGLDPLTFAVVPALLAGVALLACWVPARRAAGVDPMRALRVD